MTRNVWRGPSRLIAFWPGLLLAMALSMGGAATVTAGSPVPEVHSSCESESTRRSTQGDVRAQLTVINLTDAAFDLFWLDYNGERVFYQVSRPHSTQPQRTWLTHPWILADPQSTCYLLIVMNAVEQTMTIGSTTGETLATPTLIPLTPSEPAGPDSEGQDQATTPPAAGEEADPGPGFPTPLVIAGLVMMGVLVGLLAATGRLFGGGGKP